MMIASTTIWNNSITRMLLIKCEDGVLSVATLSNEDNYWRNLVPDRSFWL